MRTQSFCFLPAFLWDEAQRIGVCDRENNSGLTAHLSGLRGGLQSIFPLCVLRALRGERSPSTASVGILITGKVWLCLYGGHVKALDDIGYLQDLKFDLGEVVLRNAESRAYWLDSGITNGFDSGFFLIAHGPREGPPK